MVEIEEQTGFRDPFAWAMAAPEEAVIIDLVQAILREDIGPGDLSAALVPEPTRIRGQLVLREPAIVCGQGWFNQCFLTLDPGISIEWRVAEGSRVEVPGVVAELGGNARAILTAERSALNLLQTLSGTATTTAHLVALLQGRPTGLLDTRKTLPGLRVAQKYAVRCGGGRNHRMGLWDAVLIKENHIAACGSISAAVAQARKLAQGRWIEVETETLDEVNEALAAGADVIMLDDFSLADLTTAVQVIKGKAVSEASGNISADNLCAVADTGVDYLSMGSLTKHLRAIDYSLRLGTC